jgi:hypothetical protein
MTVGIAAAMLAPAIMDLRSFAAEVRQVALDAEGDLPDALRTIAIAAEATADRLVNGEPATAFTENDLMMIMMLAGYTSGNGGITQAAALVRTLLDEHENDGGDTGGNDG